VYTVSQKTAQLWNGIARNDVDRFWWYLAEIFRRLQNRVCMIQFSCRFAFSSTFRLSNRTPKIARILTLCQANAATLTLLSKEDKILIKSLQECKSYNAQQFMNKGWTKNSINRLLVKFRTVERRLGSGRRSVHTDENVDTVESLLLSQEDKPQSQEKFQNWSLQFRAIPFQSWAVFWDTM